MGPYDERPSRSRSRRLACFFARRCFHSLPPNESLGQVNNWEETSTKVTNEKSKKLFINDQQKRGMSRVVFLAWHPIGWMARANQRANLFGGSLFWLSYPRHVLVRFSWKLPSSHLYFCEERGTARVKCFAQEHSTMTPMRAIVTRTTRFGVQDAKHQFSHLQLNYIANNRYLPPRKRSLMTPLTGPVNLPIKPSTNDKNPNFLVTGWVRSQESASRWNFQPLTKRSLCC